MFPDQLTKTSKYKKLLWMINLCWKGKRNKIFLNKYWNETRNVNVYGPNRNSKRKPKRLRVRKTVHAPAIKILYGLIIHKSGSVQNLQPRQLCIYARFAWKLHKCMNCTRILITLKTLSLSQKSNIIDEKRNLHMTFVVVEKTAKFKSIVVNPGKAAYFGQISRKRVYKCGGHPKISTPKWTNRIMRKFWNNFSNCIMHTNT